MNAEGKIECAGGAVPSLRGAERFLPLALAAAAALVYLDSFDAAFILDDQDTIVGNDTIRSLLPLSRSFWGPIGSGVAGRPAMNFSFALNFAACGLSPAGFRAANLAIHILAGLALFGILRRTFWTERLRGRFGAAAAPMAFAASLLWLVHPIQSEAVVYITARNESMMGLFYLATLYAFIRASSSPRPARWLPAIAAASLLGMATKETMATAPIVIALYDRAFLSRSWPVAARLRWKAHAAAASGWPLLAWLVAQGQRSATTGFGLRRIKPAEYALTQCGVIARYLRLAFWPDSLVFDYYGWPLARTLGEAMPWAALLAALLAAAALAFWLRPPVGFLGAWFFVILAPSSSVMPITEIAWEYRMYLPLAALAAGAIVAAVEASRRMGARFGWSDRARARSLAAALAIVAVSLGVRTALRNRDYRSERALYVDSLAKWPGNPRARLRLGAELERAGDFAQAMANYQEAARMAPEISFAHVEIGLMLARDRKWAEALGEFEEALRLEPEPEKRHRSMETLHNAMGIALAELGRSEEALPHYRKALEIKPDYVEAQYNLGYELLRLSRAQEAAAELGRAVALDPRLARARVDLGRALEMRGDASGAISQFEEALALEPNNPGTHNRLGEALARAGRVAEAIPHFSRAVQLAPNYAQAKANLAKYAPGSVP